MCVCVSVCVRVRACFFACMLVCARACVYANILTLSHIHIIFSFSFLPHFLPSHFSALHQIAALQFLTHLLPRSNRLHDAHAHKCYRRLHRKFFSINECTSSWHFLHQCTPLHISKTHSHCTILWWEFSQFRERFVGNFVWRTHKLLTFLAQYTEEAKKEKIIKRKYIKKIPAEI